MRDGEAGAVQGRPETAVGCGAVEIQGVARTAETRRQHQGLAVDDHAEVAHEGAVEDGVHGFPVVAGAIRVPPDADARTRWSGLRVRIARWFGRLLTHDSDVMCHLYTACYDTNY